MSTPATPSLLGPSAGRGGLRVDLVERGHSPGQVIWFYRLDTDRDIQGRYLCGRRELDDLGFTVTLGSFSDSLPARETRRRCTAVASFGYGIQRGEIGNGQGCLSSRLR